MARVTSSEYDVADVIDYPPAFLCPISGTVMRDPVSTEDGHVYERASIVKWFAKSKTSPNTGLPLASDKLTPNIGLRKAIQEHEELQVTMVPFSQLVLVREIGKGSFKTVYSGKFRGKDVAVLCSGAQGVAMNRAELATLVKLRSEMFLVNFLGVALHERRLYFITGLAAHGCLLDVLEHDDVQRQGLSEAHMSIMAHQICMGMSILARHGIVHRDLAARNVLVAQFDLADPATTHLLITDYGLSLAMQAGRSHATVEEGIIPTRYCPPEVLCRRHFSEKSDVWAYGVTLWEMVSRAMVPYADIADTASVSRFVCGGGRLPRPTDARGAWMCSTALWTLICTCWVEQPEDRPDFQRLLARLAMLHVPTGPADASTAIVIDDHVAPAAATGAAAAPRMRKRKRGGAQPRTTRRRIEQPAREQHAVDVVAALEPVDAAFVLLGSLSECRTRGADVLRVLRDLHALTTNAEVAAVVVQMEGQATLLVDLLTIHGHMPSLAHQLADTITRLAAVSPASQQLFLQARAVEQLTEVLPRDTKRRITANVLAALNTVTDSVEGVTVLVETPGCVERILAVVAQAGHTAEGAAAVPLCLSLLSRVASSDVGVARLQGVYPPCHQTVLRLAHSLPLTDHGCAFVTLVARVTPALWYPDTALTVADVLARCVGAQQTKQQLDAALLAVAHACVAFLDTQERRHGALTHEVIGTHAGVLVDAACTYSDAHVRDQCVQLLQRAAATNAGTPPRSAMPLSTTH